MPADQTTALGGISKVPAQGVSLAVDNSAVKEWKFTDANGTGGDSYFFEIALWSTVGWLYGTAANNVVVPVAANEKLTVRVAYGGSIFVKAASTGGSIFSLRVA